MFLNECKIKIMTSSYQDLVSFDALEALALDIVVFVLDVLGEAGVSG